jgi:hypothetical protein
MQNLVDVVKGKNGAIYLTGMLKNQQNSELCGDITYSITSKVTDGERKVTAGIDDDEKEIKLTETEWWKNKDKDVANAA